MALTLSSNQSLLPEKTASSGLTDLAIQAVHG